MSGYSVYSPVRAMLARTAAASGRFSKKDRCRSDFADNVVRDLYLNRPDALRMIESRIIAEELAWRDVGHPMYFPDTPELLDMLWRAKVDVRIEDLNLPTFPRAFAFSWPEHLVDGVQPVGCLLWWGDGKDWKDAVVQFEKKFLVPGKYDSVRNEPVPDMRLGIHMSFSREDEEARQVGVERSYYRASIPDDQFQSGMTSVEEFEKFRKYDSPNLIGVIPLKPEEMHVQYVTMRLAVRMLIYMRACPEHVRSGYPGNKNRKAFESRWTEIGPHVVVSPHSLMHGTHGSPIAHLRTWYFRSYPVKKDGTRKDGVVFVNATMVNADVEPVTAEEGGQINDGT